MRRSLRPIVVAAFALAVLGTGLAVALTVGRGRTPPIGGERAVASLEQVSLGGAPQWVLIRGRDRRNPVVLFLHGGPGMPAMFLAHAFQREAERDFVMVQWDRRGAGKSFDAAEPRDSLTVRRTLDDLFELTRLLRARFGQGRIFLVGHSWGTYLGLLAIREHPEYFAAYVGMGQMAGDTAAVRTARRAFLTRAAAAAGDSVTLGRLAAGSRGTEDDLFTYGAELRGAQSFWPILRTGLLAPEYTLRDALNVKRGAELVAKAMRYDVAPRPLAGEVPAVEVPIYFFLGRYDFNTPSPLASSYLARLRAPRKGITWFERSAHFPFFEEPARFAAELGRVARETHDFWAERAVGEIGAAPARLPAAAGARAAAQRGVVADEAAPQPSAGRVPCGPLRC